MGVLTKYDQIEPIYVSTTERCNICLDKTASVVYESEFLATDPEVPGSIPGATRFSEKYGSGTGFTQPREDN
jgi:hypothetical protein